MKITLILTLIFLSHAAFAKDKLKKCDPSKYLFEAVLEYVDYESKEKVKTTEYLSYFTIREKYLEIKVTALKNYNLKSAVLLGENLETPFLLKDKTAITNISTLNISLYEDLTIHVEDTKEQTCEMVFAITRD